MKAAVGKRIRILIVEDKADIVHHVGADLKNAGFDILRAADGVEALTLARDVAPALILLDLMLPEMSGLEVLKQLKIDPVTDRIAVVMLSAKAEETDCIVALELGADDYVTKPFSPRELTLRVKSILRTTQQRVEIPGSIRVGEVEIHYTRFEVRVAGQLIDLTATELKLLTLLAERPGRLQSRDRLLVELWGYGATIETRAIDTLIRRLRVKLGPARHYIETVRSFGYRMSDFSET